MQVKTWNKFAQRKYEAFIGALENVAFAFEEAKALIETYDPGAAEQITAKSWSTPDQDELRDLLGRAFRDTDVMRAKSRAYAAELKSREWRV